nr:AraC family transcriptional regulator [uncultured Agathobaculum sp.]
MLIPECGVHQTSERYFFTPSTLARELFYYPTRCGHYFCNSEYSFSYRSEIARQGDHNQNIMLFLLQSGAMELQLADRTMLATAGQVVIFDCREPYRYHGSDGLKFTWLLFNGLNTRDFYRRIVQARGGRQVFSPPAAAEIARLLDGLMSGCAADERPSEAARSQLIHRLLCLLLLDEHDPAHDGSDRIALAIRYIHRHLFEPLSVQDVAAAVNLSPSHFSREFKTRTGYSPYEYIVLRRIDKAKYLLTSTRQTVGEVAYATGYHSEENFIHSFQKHVGIPPGLFRKYPV